MTNVKLWVRANPRPFSLSSTPMAVGKSGLGFALTRSIAEIWTSPSISRLCMKLEQIRDHFSQPPWGYLTNKSGLGFALTWSLTGHGHLSQVPLKLIRNSSGNSPGTNLVDGALLLWSQGIWHSGIFGVQSTIQIHNCFWSAIHLSIQSIFWIVDGSNPDSTPLQLLDWSAEWSEALHFLSSIQISLHSQFKTGHVDEMTKTKFCLGNKQFPKSGMKLPHSS